MFWSWSSYKQDSSEFLPTFFNESGDAAVAFYPVPGSSREDVSVTQERDLVTLHVKKRLQVPEGFEAPHDEASTQVIRLSGGYKVSKATVKDGMCALHLVISKGTGVPVE